MRAARRGDVGSFETLYRRHVGRIHASCLWLTLGRAAAEGLSTSVSLLLN